MNTHLTEAPRLPSGQHWIDDEDRAAVDAVLRSAWLTTGPRVEAFERAVADACGAHHAVAVSSGTAALHAAMAAAAIGPGDEVIVPAITFVATANAAVFQGATPVFADVESSTLLVDPAGVAAKITPRTKAIVAVDYAGQPCDYRALRAIADRHGLVLIADACHALGAADHGQPVGSLADLSTFSFHPVKHITTGEGGMITTQRAEWAERMRRFRNHGLDTDVRERRRQGTWRYDMTALGWNYRLSDLQCALGLSQLRHLPAWVARRQTLARRYRTAFTGIPGIEPLTVRSGATHAYHLFVIRIDAARYGADRQQLFDACTAEGIGANVHYLPVHLHRFYRECFGTAPGLCPQAETAYEQILSLPIFPRMTDADVDRVIAIVRILARTPSR